MKIIYTPAEATAILQSQNSEATVIVEETESKTITFEIDEALRHVRQFDYKGYQKVMAIKDLRSYASSCGVCIPIGSAKNFVERV